MYVWSHALPSYIRIGIDHGGGNFYITFLPFPMTNTKVDEVKLYVTTPESTSVPVTFNVSAPGTGFSESEPQ